jgi:hypothetical protein
MMMSSDVVIAMRARVVLTMVFARVVFAVMPTVMFAPMMTASVMTTTVVSPAVMSASMTATAASEDGTGQQQAGQRGQSPANAEKPWFRAAADDFSPVRRCSALEIVALGRQLDAGFHRATFLESGRSENASQSQDSKRDSADRKWV